MKNLLIKRIDDDGVQTLGEMFVLDKDKHIEFSCKTLELTWARNKNRISCIPSGKYEVLHRWSPKHKEHFHITDVKGRTFILIHKGNYHSQILGCVLVGDDFKEVNGDGRLDVVNSGNTLDKLLKLMPQKFTLEILKA